MRTARFAAPICALAVAGCHYVPFSEGREQALERLYRCDARGDHPAHYRVVALRHGLQFRESRESEDMHLAGGELGESEFLFQRIGEQVKISLWVRPGLRASAAEQRIFDEMAALFADCEATGVPRRAERP